MIASPHLSPASTAQAGLAAWVAKARAGVTELITHGPGPKTIRYGIMAVTVVVAGLGWHHRAEIFTATQTFIARATDAQVETVQVEGATYTLREDLITALQIKKGEPLVGFNTAAARARLEQLPWVRLAAVEKQLPQAIHVVVYEHVPLARVMQDDGKIWVVNKDGKPVVPEAGSRFAHLPLLEGDGAATAAARLFGVLAQWPNLSTQLQRASYVGSRRWDLHFTSGVTVQLPEENPHLALATLAELERARHVLTLPGGEVDLRLPDRVGLRLPASVGETPVTQQPAQKG
jgi:cell division protein FtsQ